MIDAILAKFDGAFAENIIRAYRSDFIQYQTWCSHNNIDSISATADAMAQYVDYLATIRKSATMRRRLELCAFKFEDICKGANGKPAIRLNFSKTDQFGTGKILPISQELFDLLEKWRSMISDESYILRSINRHGHFGNKLHPASISTLLKALQKDLKMNFDDQPLSGHSFRVGAPLIY